MFNVIPQDLVILPPMTVNTIIASIDSEIARLTKARVLLATETSKDRAAPARKVRKLSVAARKRIADAQRKRWAKQKKAE
jgi:hypothetical protein